MLVPIFSLKLNNKICARTVAVGKYDGIHPCLTAATLAGKVFIHNPHRKYSVPTGAGRSSIDDATSADTNLSMLNINAVVTALATGSLDPTSRGEILFVGTKTSLLAYDVNNNTDLFFKELPDGANAIVVGTFGSQKEPVVIVGGNCSIVALNKLGEEVLWTVTGDNVCSLALVDFNMDGINELIVGSEDFDIRVFKDDEIIHEMSETEAIIAICPLSAAKFGYALANGSVGVYDKSFRAWRIKSRNMVMAIDAFDINADGVPELITGWSSGKVDARNVVTGEVVFKCNLESSVAGLIHSDYKMDGIEQLICCSVEGEIKGFKALSSHALDMASDRNINQETIRDMTQRKQNLLLELSNLEEASKPSVERKFDEFGTQSTGIPANTQIQSNLSTHLASGLKKGYVQLHMQTNNETIIKAIIVFAEGIFKGESYVVHPQSNSLRHFLNVPFILPKDGPVDLHMQILVGYENATQYHVIEQTRVLPYFSMYSRVEPDSVAEPKGFVTFSINERIQRIAIWINNNFILTDDLICEGALSIAFIALRTNKPLVIKMELNGQFTIKTDEMELAGLLVQSLISYLNLNDLQTTCDFPEELESLQQLMTKIEQSNSVRQNLVSQIADHSNLVRSLVVRAEDSRLMEDIEGMKKNYFELMNLNRDLLSGYRVRSTNHEELLRNVKLLNQVVQRAGNLRGGKYKTDLIANARQAIKQNNANSLLKIIRVGSS